MEFQEHTTTQPDETHPVTNGKQVEYKLHLPNKNGPVSSKGIEMTVTSVPHRNGNPDHRFYEVWFKWEGGSIRSSTAIHDPLTRGVVCNTIHALTGMDYATEIAQILDPYDWKQNPL